MALLRDSPQTGLMPWAFPMSQLEGAPAAAFGIMQSICVSVPSCEAPYMAPNEAMQGTGSARHGRLWVQVRGDEEAAASLGAQDEVEFEVIVNRRSGGHRAEAVAAALQGAGPA